MIAPELNEVDPVDSRPRETDEFNKFCRRRSSVVCSHKPCFHYMHSTEYGLMTFCPFSACSGERMPLVSDQNCGAAEQQGRKEVDPLLMMRGSVTGTTCSWEERVPSDASKPKV